MNTENSTQFHKSEKELDALRSLFKRRPILCLLVILGLVCSAVYAGYQAITIRNVEKAYNDLEKQLETVKQKRDTLADQLAPFLAAADLRFPDDPPDKRLELLLKRYEKTMLEVDPVTRKMGPERQLSESVRERVIERLKQQQKLKVNITSVLGDSEAYSLAEQLKTVFLNAGWPVSKGSVRLGIFYKPQRGCRFYFTKRPSPAMQEIFLEILDTVGEKQKLFLDPQQTEGTLEVVVGSR